MTSHEIQVIWITAAVLHGSKGLLLLLLPTRFSGTLGRAARWWASGCLVFSLWFTLLIFLPPSVPSLFPTAAFGTLGFTLQLAAVAELTGQPWSRSWLWGPTLATVGTSLWAEGLYHNVTLSMLCSNAIRMIVMGAVAWQLLRPGRPFRPASDVAAGFVFITKASFTLGVIVFLLAASHLARSYAFGQVSLMTHNLAWIVLSNVAFVLFLLSISERINAETSYHATHDPLTNLLNRRAIEEVGSRLVRSAARHRQPFSAFMIDIDHFKQINDRYGHSVGDAILRQTAGGLLSIVRGEDLVGRWGGDEFCVLLPGATRAQAETVALRALEVLNQLELSEEKYTLRFSISIGIVTRQDGSLDLNSLLNQADIALYRAKETGRRRMVST